MVGALADWFAVTALFRHPLRLPIPHTAIIPRKKDQIGASLGTFVQENFLTRQVVEQKLDTVDVPGRLGAFLAAPGRAERLAGDAAVALDRADRPAPGRRRPARRRRAGRPQAARDAGRAGAWPACWSWSSRATGTRRCCRRRCAAWPASCRRTGSCSGRSWATPPRPGCPTGWTTGCSTGRSPACRPSSTRSATTRGTSCAGPTTPACAPTCTPCAPIPATAARVEELKRELLEHPAVRTWSGSLWTNAKNAVARRRRRPGLGAARRGWRR